MTMLELANAHLLSLSIIAIPPFPSSAVSPCTLFEPVPILSR